jgi:c-di-GMP-binding flagellar brake protein YcgR
MGDRRKAKRYSIYLPLQVYTTRKTSGECFAAQLRDISRLGVYFHSSVALEPGCSIELTFALSTEKDRTASVLVKASAKALRVSALNGDVPTMYGVAATIDRIDFVRPMVSHAA